MSIVVSASLGTLSAFTTNGRGLAKWGFGIQGWDGTAPQGQVSFAKRLNTYPLDLIGVPDFEAVLASSYDFEVTLGNDVADPAVQLLLYDLYVDVTYDDGSVTRFRATTFLDNGPSLGVVDVINPLFACDLDPLSFATFPLTTIATVVRYRTWTSKQLISGPVPRDPQLILRCSDDGGLTFGVERQAAMGKLGNYSQLARWRQLGRSRDRVFEVICSEPVDVALIAADLDSHG